HHHKLSGEETGEADAERNVPKVIVRLDPNGRTRRSTDAWGGCDGVQWNDACRSAGYKIPAGKANPGIHSAIPSSSKNSVREAFNQRNTSMYSITSSASANSLDGTVRLSALAVLRLITSSNLGGC